MLRYRYILAVMLIVLLTAAIPLSAQQWEKLTAGGEFSLALRSDGTLWGCGYNGNGQLGTGDKQQRSVLAQIGTDTDWSDIEAGGFHTLALKSDGTLWSFGFNAAGQLGLGDNAERLSPTQVGTDTDWAAIEAGYATSFAIKKDGSMWAWGYNPYGQIGNGKSGNENAPVEVLGDHQWAQVSAGAAHVLAIDRDGYLWSWGGGPNGQLGQGDYTERKTPQEVATLQESVYRCIAGSAFGFALTQTGDLYAWGINIYGQLGFDDLDERRVPEKVPSTSPWSDVAAAEGIIANQVVFGHHALALHEARKVICVAGANYVRQIGLPTDDPSMVFSCAIGDLTLAVDAPPAQPSVPHITVYPNPARNHIMLRQRDDAVMTMRARDVRLFDLLGRSQPVRVRTEGEVLDVDVSGLPRGTYFLRVITADGVSRPHRISLF